MEPEASASAAPAAAAEERAPGERSLRPLYVSPRGLTRVLLAAVVASTLASWLALGVHLAQLIQLRAVLAGGAHDPKRLATVASVLKTTEAAQFGIYALTTLLFLVWLYRLRVNVRAFGMRKLVYARHWSVLGFCVPVLNVVRPFQVIGEIWRASDPAVLDPFEWKTLEPPQLLTFWWASIVVAATLQLAALGMLLTAGTAAFESLVASTVSVIANLLSALAATLTWFLVSRLAAEQMAKRERLRLEAPFA